MCCKSLCFNFLSLGPCLLLFKNWVFLWPFSCKYFWALVLTEAPTVGVLGSWLLPWLHQQSIKGFTYLRTLSVFIYSIYDTSNTLRWSITEWKKIFLRNLWCDYNSARFKIAQIGLSPHSIAEYCSFAFAFKHSYSSIPLLSQYKICPSFLEIFLISSSSTKKLFDNLFTLPHP